jgi:hypothetical protein
MFPNIFASFFGIYLCVMEPEPREAGSFGCMSYMGISYNYSKSNVKKKQQIKGIFTLLNDFDL